MIHFQNSLVSFFKLSLYFQCIKPISILLNDTMGLPHIPHTIIYTTNGTALKNKQKSKRCNTFGHGCTSKYIKEKLISDKFTNN